MTLNEALEIIGISVVISMIRTPGYEGVSFQLYNAVVEEWLDGNLEFDQEKLRLVIEGYGTNSLKQAARVVANKVDVYGDVS